MNSIGIYSQYSIPPNLQRHQLEVAAVCWQILDQWDGSAIDTDLTIKTALLHDMGNIIKFKRPFMGELEAQARYWEKIQDDFISKYGTDVKTATTTIASELGLAEVLQVLKDMELLIAGSSLVSWEARVVQFGDMHVSPQGVVSFSERLTDLLDRYHYSGSEPWVQVVKENYKIVEEQLKCKIENIDLVNILFIIEQLKYVDISLAQTSKKPIEIDDKMGR